MSTVSRRAEALMRAKAAATGKSLAAWWRLEPAFGNHGLWAALIVFFADRGLTFGLHMPALERTAFGRG